MIFGEMKKTRWTAALLVMTIAVLVYQVLAFLRLKQQHIQFFHSRTEILLFGAMVVVMLFAIVVKSRQQLR